MTTQRYKRTTDGKTFRLVSVGQSRDGESLVTLMGDNGRCSVVRGVGFDLDYAAIEPGGKAVEG